MIRLRRVSQGDQIGHGEMALKLHQTREQTVLSIQRGESGLKRDTLSFLLSGRF